MVAENDRLADRVHRWFRSQRQLAPWREDAHPDVGVVGLKRQDERGFGERHFERDPLHEGRVEPGGLRKHRQLVARERAPREHVVVKVSMTGHPSMLVYARPDGTASARA